MTSSMPTTSSIPPVKVDRILRDGDTIRMGEVLLTAYHTPGHTRGATTWVANVVIDGKPYVVVFPDGAGFNPGYRLTKDPILPRASPRTIAARTTSWRC